MFGVPEENLRLWLDIGAILVPFAFAVFMLKMRATFVTKPQFANWARKHGEDHAAIADRLSRGEREFADIHATLRTLATSDQVGRLRNDVTKVEGEMRTLEKMLVGRVEALDEKIDGQIDVNRGTAALVALIHQHLLQQAQG